jgi:hypothetical protein
MFRRGGTRRVAGAANTRLWALVCVLGLPATGCARPYAGPKTMAAIGTALVVGGASMWIAGERTDRKGLVTGGAIGTFLGVGVVIGAGGWLAGSIACDADPDCPEGEECREVPAPPGGVPYKQCVRR